MSILRYSVFENDFFVPRADGLYDKKPFTRRDGVGKIGTFKRPDDKRREKPELDAAAKAISVHLEWIKGAYAKLRPDAPVCVMVHGFLFDPSDASKDRDESDNPHVRVYHFNADANPNQEIKNHTTGWPVRLGFAESDEGQSGLAIAFGWYSKPGLAKAILSGTPNFYARAYDYSRSSAWSFLALLDALGTALPDRPVDIFCHSLGSAIVMRSLAMGADLDRPVLRKIERVIVLGGSEYCGEAQVTYRSLSDMAGRLGIPSGRGPHVYNMVSRENFVLDVLAENFGPKSFFSSSEVIGHDGLRFSSPAPRWIDFQIDGSRFRNWALGRNLDIRGDQPGDVWDHWYYYTWPGNMEMYKSILRDRPNWAFNVLRGTNPVPEGVT